MNNVDHFLWVEKYRPKTVQDTILPTDLKTMFQQFVDTGSVPNLLLCGGPGCGKTTVARAILEELGYNYIIINGSLNANIDLLRNDIKEFASAVSFNNKRKFVILDEADYLNHHIQPALRNFIEEFSKTCGFIFTCNFKNKIMEPLHSRCSVVEFKFHKKGAAEVAKQIFLRVLEILDKENIKYDKKVIVELIKKYYPDFRRIINELQKYSVGGVIDSGILATFSDQSLKQLIEFLKNRDFSSCRKWVADNDIDEAELYRKLYDTANEYCSIESVPHLVLIIAKYQYQSAFAADKQINLLACLVELTAELEFN